MRTDAFDFMITKHPWEKLSDEQRNLWTEHVTRFYPPNTVTPQEAIELAREEYNETESLVPVVEACEAD
jgi:hypothetical protein